MKNRREREILYAYQTQKAKLGNQEHTFMHGAKWADAHPHWISVEDELPPIRQGVIAYNGVTIRKAWVLEDGSWIADTHKEWERNCFKQYPVTHWMPLPPVVSNSSNIGKDLKGGEQ